ncbi:NAD(P)/FAD-dependent oxidoreductase [Sphaerisporangium aureirubrum]|uniref:NAD(P)/FAD-dependent oxidoreductase n=1 Tax=Sphaerisporangium aureirubrum TaxID=1544736 RepID=A0ABW1NFD4_9ACTN
MSNSMPPRRPTVAVIGGGYGGVAVAKKLDDVADVVLVEPKESFEHSIAGLRALVDPSWLTKVYLPYDNLLTHGRVVRDHAVAVESGRVVLGSGQEIAADYIVLATGSRYPFPGKAGVFDTEAAHELYRISHEALATADRVLLLGSGPVGIELAGEIKEVWPDKKVTIAELGDDILPGPFMPELRVALRRHLDELGVELLFGGQLSEEPPVEPGTAKTFGVATKDGGEFTADIWFRCYGVTPVTGYLTGDLAPARTPGNRIDVTAEMRVTGGKNVFAVGDIVARDSPMAGRAGMQAEVVAGNIRAAITGEGEQVAYVPMPPVIAVPIGPRRGAGQLPGVEGVVEGETIAEIKGRDLMVGRLAETLGLPEAATR